MSSDHTIRTIVRLSGSVPATLIMGRDVDGVYIDGDFKGVADGWYDNNLPGLVPTGLWDGGINEGLAQGLYENNIRITLKNGLWDTEAWVGDANGWYVENEPAQVPNGYWDGGALEDVPDGVWNAGANDGLAQGWYDSNLPGQVPTGLWDGLGNRTDATGWYQDNLKVTLTNGLWVAEVYQGEANGWYQNSLPATMDNGLWIANSYIGMVNGWYVNNIRVTLVNGLWVGEEYKGEANGWYVDNEPAVMATGIWEGNSFREIATGLYDNNVKLPFDSGLWVDEEYKGKATGYYVSNVKTAIPDGQYRGGGLVDPYYEKIRDAALAEGGGLYLFQLERGEYAGEQVIWQEMAETNPWTPGLGLPQGKTYDLMGSGEYLGQSVSMRRPVDGVWDGVSSWMDASSKAVGNALHQSGESAWFAGIEVLTVNNNAVIVATGRATVGQGGIEVRQNNGGLVQYRRSGGAGVGNGAAYTIGLLPVTGDHVVGVSYGTRYRLHMDGAVVFDGDPASPYADTPADHVLRVGAATYGGQLIHAHYTYVAIYTREPTALEISLHKRTP